jgi:hypothetical protein
VLIVDARQVTRWQLAALQRLGEIAPVLVLSCRNTRARRSIGKHFLYYVFNRFTVRNYWSRKVAIDGSSVRVREIVDFDSDYDGSWQRLPQAVIDRIAAEQADAVLKFGMNLLRVPPALETPILSYHHGDPDQYRGRPAGFWESFHGKTWMGQIVQIISDRLDAGAVVAYGETRIVPHSYRATIMKAYRHSPLLLRRAIENAMSGRRIPKPCTGRNYRLPGNMIVARLLLRQASAIVGRLLYGAFFEKSWTVSTAPASAEAFARDGTFPAAAQWCHLARSGRHIFHADPFYIDEPAGILVEAMNRSTGKGELVLVRGGAGEALVSDPRRHFSYPATVRENGRTYVVPEISHWSAPAIFELRDGGLEEVGRIDVDESPRITDPTFFRHEDRLYLFGNKTEEGTDALYLWSSDSLFGRFVEHPSNPILVSPSGSRMAGQILSCGGAVYRFGQSSLKGYGNGALIFRINALTPSAYAETCVRELRFEDVRGPHTVNWADGEVLFDWYEDRFGALAWLRRLRARLG